MFEHANVLVTGGGGFVGTNLVARLVALGANVRATLHRKGPAIDDPRVDYVRCDLTRMEDCRRVVREMDYVFMCAATTSGAAVIKWNPLAHVTPNVVMNAQMLEAAYLARVRKFVWLSSNAAYPPTGDRPVREDEMFSGDPYELYYGVAWMKRYTEILCRMYSERLPARMATVVLRPSNIYGPYDDFAFETSHVTAALIRRVVERHNPIVVWGNGNDVRDLIYIDDFIDAAIIATERIGGYDPINVASGRGCTVREILQTALDVDGYPNANVEFDRSKPSMIPVRLIDTTKASERLGFCATTELHEGLRRTVSWYRQRSAGLQARPQEETTVPRLA